MFMLSAAVTCRLGDQTHCKLCIVNTTCIECEPGYFGENCTKACSPGCLQNLCWQVNGRCKYNTCLHGYYGDLCCPLGFTSSTCRMRCPANCLQCYSQESCTKCVDGFYGSNCLTKCSVDCQFGTCNAISGRCFDGCLKGYYGVSCCLRGFYGRECNSKCPAHCSECETAHKCTACDFGYYGELCTKKCPEKCMDSVCSKDTGACGTCLDGFYGDNCCPYGKYGEYCSACPENCKTCTSYTFCPECDNGYYGVTCTHNCSIGCESSK